MSIPRDPWDIHSNDINAPLDLSNAPEPSDDREHRLSVVAGNVGRVLSVGLVATVLLQLASVVSARVTPNHRIESPLAVISRQWNDQKEAFGRAFEKLRDDRTFYKIIKRDLNPN